MPIRTLIFLSFLVPALASAENPGNYNPYPSDGAQGAVEAARAGTQRYVDQLIRRELERRQRPAPPPSRRRNCGKSFWTKREALRLCPPATAMKVRQDGGVFFYCDCE